MAQLFGRITLLKATLNIVVELMQPSVLIMVSHLQPKGIHECELLSRQQVLRDVLLVAVGSSTEAGQVAFPCCQVQVIQDSIKHAVIKD